MKKSTWDMTLEIGRAYQTRAGLMFSAWSEEHITWLLDRWQFKRPMDSDRIALFRTWLRDCIAYRRVNGVAYTKVFVFRPWLVEMLQQSAVMADIIQPPQRQSMTRRDDRIVVLKQRPPVVWIDEVIDMDARDPETTKAIDKKLDAFLERHKQKEQHSDRAN